MDDYTGSDVAIWQTWVVTLRRLGFASLTADLLDALGSLTLFGAQMVYLAQPVLSPFIPQSHLDALADMLDDPRRTHAFTSALRGAAHADLTPEDLP